MLVPLPQILLPSPTSEPWHLLHLLPEKLFPELALSHPLDPRTCHHFSEDFLIPFLKLDSL